MTTTRTARRISIRSAALKSWGIWTLGFVSFPLGGVLARAISGPVDAPAAAAIGGAVTGLVIGTGQWLASRRRLDPKRWIPATTVGMSVGLLLGAAAVGYRTGLADLALMGFLTGLPLGVAQALALPPGSRSRWSWAAVMPALWALGWTLSTAIGVDVDAQYTVFGAIGAVTVSALAGLLLQGLLPSATIERDASVEGSGSR